MNIHCLGLDDWYFFKPSLQSVEVDKVAMATKDI